MGYVYTALWLLAALLLFVKFRKESWLVYVLSGYFLFAGCWWLANQLTEQELLSGVYGWIFRGVSIVMLVLLIVVHFLEKRSAAGKAAANAEGMEQDDQAVANTD